MENNYNEKYLKYKMKYTKLKNQQKGGSKDFAKELANYSNMDIFNINSLKLKANESAEFMLDTYIKLYPKAKEMLLPILDDMSLNLKTNKYLHNYFIKNIDNFYNRIYKDINGNNSCTTSSGMIKHFKFINFPESGMLTIKKDLLVNTLPDLPTPQTYNYVLIFVTDMNTNQSYYYLILQKYPNNFEYISKHSNLRIFLPDEWKDNEDIDTGLIASGELSFNNETKHIIFDFNSSSMIIDMFDTQSKIIKNFKLKYLDKLMPSSKTLMGLGYGGSITAGDKQIVGLLYFFINYSIMYNVLSKIKERHPTASDYTIKTHAHYYNHDKITNADKNNNLKYMFNLGFVTDPHSIVGIVGGIHDYSNKTCQTTDEIKRINKNTLDNYTIEDLDDNNKFINCAAFTKELLDSDVDPAKATAFVKYCDKILKI